LYVPDLPGHGSRFKEELTLENAMETIAKVIETLPDKKALIIGYSLGAYISMAFAGHYPQMCVGVIAGGAGADLSRPLNNFAVKVIGALTTLIPPPTIVTAALGQASKEEVPITEIEPLLTSGSLSNVRITEAINHKILLWPGFGDYLAKYDGPILFLDGEKDTRNGEERVCILNSN
jgi:pimeloyl-ACP methyl ester carboxylesterase